MRQPPLAFGLRLQDLYQREGLLRLDAAFLESLAAQDAALHAQLLAARAQPEALAAKEESALLLALAPYVETHVVELFSIHAAYTALVAQHHRLTPIFLCKRLFVQRKAAKAYNTEHVQEWDGDALYATLALHFAALVAPENTEDFELMFAHQVLGWMDDAAQHADALDAAQRYAAWAIYSVSGINLHGKGVLFHVPKKTDSEHLLELESTEFHNATMLHVNAAKHRSREGFACTDDGGTLTQALDQAHYCIFCHNQGKDSCSKGMKETKADADTPFKRNALDIPLAGCPLEEKISEMHTLKSQGVALGALAMVTVDNPMAAGTGHRICNDCMKSCIYQKQEPVNIPQAETRILRDILELPFGFEIYSLLTRWNPLNLRRPLPRERTGKKILIAGLGPAGYTLAHHLMQDGHSVVAVDGLKIEPLDASLSGIGLDGIRQEFTAIEQLTMIEEPLDTRVLAGFGGVAEYGITVRWNKNYLKILRLLLERRAEFRMFGGVRLGSTLTTQQAFALGFDHIALCMGAGKPTILDITNGLARGVRTASDFLMSLQLTGAAKRDSIANLQVRLPIVVIGGGLTAIDTATESLAYYPLQVEKFLARFEALCAARGEQQVRAGWSMEESEIAEEFLRHARAIRAERALAKQEKRTPRIGKLLDEWGGVRLVYRKRLMDAPSYRLNHEEVEKALEEGIFFAPLLEPVQVEIDAYGHARELVLRQTGDGKEVRLPARTILVAAGTHPNTMLAREEEGIEMDGRYFRAVNAQGQPVKPQRSAKPTTPHVLMHVDEQGRSMSFFGDLHPSFAGNVVKAMGSAKQGHPVVTAVLATHAPRNKDTTETFFARMQDQLQARVEAIRVLTPTIVEVIVRAPLAAQAFEPGQFYRLQNYEAHALRANHSGIETTLSMEGLALTGAWVDREQGLLSTIVLEMGGSSDLCRFLQPGQPVILMGPTGEPTEIPAGETVLLAGGGLGNAVLFSIGKALRTAGCKVLYFAAYKKAIDRYKTEMIEAAADHVIWCCDDEELSVHRPQDYTFRGNIVQAMESYAKGKFGAPPIALQAVQRVIAIGSDRMMAAVAQARHTVLKPYFQPDHEAIGSINSPMQCMMKEICAQCLQQHRDPVTGKEYYVFSCTNQDQKLDFVSFDHLRARLQQNSLSEKLTAQWVDLNLRSMGMRK